MLTWTFRTDQVVELESFVQHGSAQPSVSGRSANLFISALHPHRAAATIGWLLVAFVCLGAARLNANVSLASDDRSADVRKVATRVVEFQPNSLAPSTFADWVEADKSASE